jgi:hypothetical protein
MLRQTILFLTIVPCLQFYTAAEGRGNKHYSQLREPVETGDTSTQAIVVCVLGHCAPVGATPIPSLLPTHNA